MEWVHVAESMESWNAFVLALLQEKLRENATLKHRAQLPRCWGTALWENQSLELSLTRYLSDVSCTFCMFQEKGGLLSSISKFTNWAAKLGMAPSFKLYLGWEESQFQKQLPWRFLSAAVHILHLNVPGAGNAILRHVRYHQFFNIWGNVSVQITFFEFFTVLELGLCHRIVIPKILAGLRPKYIRKTYPSFKINFKKSVMFFYPYNVFACNIVLIKYNNKLTGPNSLILEKLARHQIMNTQYIYIWIPTCPMYLFKSLFYIRNTWAYS